MYSPTVQRETEIMTWNISSLFNIEICRREQRFGSENILGETLLLVGYSQYLKDGRLQNVEEEKVYMVKAIVDDKSKSYLQYD